MSEQIGRSSPQLVENRLRAALAARAGLIDLDDLRRGDLPSAGTVRRFPVRRAALALLALAAVVVTCVLLVPEVGRNNDPVVPARPSVPDGHSPAPRVHRGSLPSPVPPRRAPRSGAAEVESSSAATAPGRSAASDATTSTRPRP